MANIYQELLYKLQSETRVGDWEVPEDGVCFPINWNQREVQIPSGSAPVLVTGDHNANIVYFEMDRYFNIVDLSEMSCVVEYINPEGKVRISPILQYDTSTPGVLRIGWVVNHSMVSEDMGTVQFAVRFYRINAGTREYEYNMSTTPAQFTVLKGIMQKGNKEDFNIEDYDYEYPANDILDIFDRIHQIENSLSDQSIFWFDLEQS